MSNRIKAIYENGVFRPVEPVCLPEGAAVEVAVAESAQFDPSDLNSWLDEAASHAPRTGTTVHVSRDHDQILYGDRRGAR